MERNIGIYYTSKYGQTEKIAAFLGDCFRSRDWEVYVTNLQQSAGTPQVANFSAVLIGGPVYRGHYPRQLREFVTNNRQGLMELPATGFFSVSLAAAPDTVEAQFESLGPVRQFLHQVSWTPDWIASFPGALNYREYNPLLRWIMDGIARKEGGPTDTSRDHELTRWVDVAKFAADFEQDAPQSPYRAESISLATRTLDELLPQFEQRIVQEIAVQASPEEIDSAIETMELADMPLAAALARIRNLGRGGDERAIGFQQAAVAFGALPLRPRQQHEVLGALIGQFWKRDYGIRPIRNLEDFRAFHDPAYTKVVTNFWFDAYHQGKTMVRTETRIHSLGTKSRRRFHAYWSLVSPGVRLYMASALRGIARSALRQHERHPVAA